MSKLYRQVEKIKPNFEKGGRLYFLHSLFDAFETFMFVPDKVTRKGSHIRDYVDLKRTMTVVVLALVPATLFGIYNIGYQHFASTGEIKSFWEIVWFGFLKFLPLLIVSYASGGLIEAIFAQIRKEEINEGFFVSGLLIPLIVPVDTPLWMLSLATMFAVLFGKEVFGGTGMNIFNPALLARAFLFFAYPSWMSGTKVWTAGLVNGKGIVDGYSGATILGQLAAEGGEKTVHLANGVGHTYSIADMFLGFIPGSIGETSTLAILIGAIFLLWTGIGSWRIMVSVFVGGYLMALLLNIFAVNPLMEFPAHLQLLVGGFAFGAVFMATDPVSAAQTNTGKYIYGFLIGAMAILIRVVNPAYPEGVMLSILLMNTFAPLIDHYVIQAHINKRLKRAKLATK